MTKRDWNAPKRIAVVAVIAALAWPALAQQTYETLPPPAQKSPAPAPAAKAPPKAAAPSAGAPTSDSGLRQRIEQLEEQIVDMQVVIGTLESLARSAPAAGTASQPYRAPTPGSAGPSDEARIDGIETQIRALTAQLEQLSDQVRALGAQRRTDATGVAPAAPPPSATETGTAARFGSTTVTSGRDAPNGPATGNDPIANMIGDNPSPGQPAGPRPLPGEEVAAAPLPGLEGDATNPKQLYETAYGYLLQQNYGAAEAAFGDFLQRYPNDALAGNAQYWLGESHFVRGQYKPAAGAFLKGYQNFAKSAKAPDSLLKLAISLDRLGQKDAACSSFAELNTRFPNAPPHVKSRAQQERQKAGCT